MSDDTIKRSDAIEALNECTDIKGFEYTQMHNALMEIPSADRPQDREQFGKTEQLRGLLQRANSRRKKSRC